MKNRELFFYYKPNNEGLKKKDQTRRVVIAGLVKDNYLHIGLSECSIKDQFIKHKGRALALGRASSKHPLRTELVLEEEKVVTQFISTAKEILKEKGIETPAKESAIIVKLNN